MSDNKSEYVTEAVADMPFSINTEYSLRNVKIETYSQLLETWEQNSIYNLEQLFSASPSYLPSVVAEITIKLAFRNVDVSKKITEHIEKLVKDDVQYSKIRFWKSLEIVLKYLPNGKYQRLRSEMRERYGKHYTFVVNRILESLNLIVSDINPEEDYLEIECPKCGMHTSFYLENIFSAHCQCCSAKKFAQRIGFDAYTAKECENDTFYEDMEETDIAFVCQLCQRVEDILNLGDIDFMDKVFRLKCTDCEGEKYLSWIADNSGNKVTFENSFISFYDTETEETANFSKREFSPANVWRKIFEIHHSTDREYAEQAEYRNHAKTDYRGKLQIPLKELPLSPRVINVLEKAGIYMLEDILAMRWEDVLKIPNLGRKSCEELFALIKRMGINWNTGE